MKKYNVLLGCTVQAYVEVLIKAKSEKDAERIAKKKLGQYADELAFEVAWSTVGNYRVVEEATIETQNELIVAARRLKPRKRTALAAAAPALLKQLKSAAQSLDYLTPEQFDDADHEANWNQMMKDINHAIAKAEGRQNDETYTDKAE